MSKRKVPPSVERKQKYQVNVIIPEDLWDAFNALRELLKQQGIKSKAATVQWIIRQFFQNLSFTELAARVRSPQHITVTNINQSIVQHNIQQNINLTQNKLLLHETFVQAYLKQEKLFSETDNLLDKLKDIIPEASSDPSRRKELFQLYQRGVECYRELLAELQSCTNARLAEQVARRLNLLEDALDRAKEVLQRSEPIPYGR